MWIKNYSSTKIQPDFHPVIYNKKDVKESILKCVDGKKKNPVSPYD